MSISRKTAKLIRDPRRFFEDYRKKRAPLSSLQIQTLRENAPTKLSAEKKPAVPPLPKVNKTRAISVYHPRVAIGESGELLYIRIQECCRKMCIPFMVGGTKDPWMRGIHLNQADGKLFSKMLVNWFADEKSLFARIDGKVFPIGQLDRQLDAFTHKSFDILCAENIAETNGNKTYFSSIIHIMFWEKHDSYSSESIYSIREKNPYVHRLRSTYFLDLMERGADVSKDRDGHLYDFDFPIDAVFTWVDGDDPEWKQQKQQFSGHVQEVTEGAARGHAEERFRNRDELKYALRSIELFAPFIRNIYLVTCGQRPSWLNELSDRITVVSHEEIYANSAVLPTFNSSGIETQLHHIEGLAEHFLYFNDDFMLTDFCTPADFFYANGTMKYFPSEARAVDDDIDDTREEYLIADGNAIRLMRHDLGKHGRFIMQHCPYPSRRSFLYELEKRYQDEFDRCAANRFRSKDDLRPIAFMQYHFAFAKGLALPSSLSHRYLALYKATIGEQFNGVMKTRKYKSICINDVGVPIDRSESVNALTANFLDSYFPLRSSFEKAPSVEDHA
jgi:hypothetical protein